MEDRQVTPQPAWFHQRKPKHDQASGLRWWVTTSVNKGRVTDVIYLDSGKAFYMVPPNILFSRLEKWIWWVDWEMEKELVGWANPEGRDAPRVKPVWKAHEPWTLSMFVNWKIQKIFGHLVWHYSWLCTVAQFTPSLLIITSTLSRHISLPHTLPGTGSRSMTVCFPVTRQPHVKSLLASN